MQLRPALVRALDVSGWGVIMPLKRSGSCSRAPLGCFTRRLLHVLDAWVHDVKEEKWCMELATA